MDKEKLDWKNIGIGAIVSTVASVFLGDFFTNIKYFFSSIGEGVVISFLNTYFKACASHDDKFLINMASFYFLILLLSRFISVVLDGEIEYKELKKAVVTLNENQEKTEKDTFEENILSQETETLSLTDLVKQQEDNLKKLTEEFKQLKKDIIRKKTKKRPTIWINRFISIYWILYCFNILIFMIFPSTTNELFERTIDKITPYTTQAKIELLKSDWVRMESKEDFDKLNEIMLQIIEENDLG